jgi:hypothetical protein
MTTERQIAANRQNAQHSTGPRTPQGKAASSRNNTRHGLHISTPVIPGMETPEAWEQHRTITIAGLAPATQLEETIAERVALILWRLGRVARYERHVTIQAQANAPADLAAEYDDTETDVDAIRTRFATVRRRLRAFARFRQLQADAPMAGKDADTIIVAIGQQVEGFDLSTFTVPGLLAVDDRIAHVPGWTVARIQQCLDAIAEPAHRNVDELVEAAVATAQRWHNQTLVNYRGLARQLRDLRRERILPETPRLESVIRYETRLNRQLSQTLGQLRQLQQPRPTSASRPAYNDYHVPIHADPYPYPEPPLTRPFCPSPTIRQRSK